jgi:hypothetical protein
MLPCLSLSLPQVRLLEDLASRVVDLKSNVEAVASQMCCRLHKTPGAELFNLSSADPQWLRDAISLLILLRFSQAGMSQPAVLPTGKPEDAR